MHCAEIGHYWCSRRAHSPSRAGDHVGYITGSYRGVCRWPQRGFMLAKVDRPLFVKVTRVLLQLGIHYVEVQSRFVCECEREILCR